MKRQSISVLVIMAFILGAFLACNSERQSEIPPSLSLSSSSAATSSVVLVSPLPDSNAPSITASLTNPTSIITTTPANLPLDFQVYQNQAVASFPRSIAFSLSGSSALDVSNVTLSYGTDKHSLVNEFGTAKPTVQSGKTIWANWTWQLTVAGPLPPGSNIWWSWGITYLSGKSTVIPKQTQVYTDSRYQWRSVHTQTMDLYWHDQNEEMLRQLTSELESDLSRVKIEARIPSERTPRVFIYRNSDEIRGAVPFTQTWTGALAFPGYNIVLTAVSPQILDWARGALAHEITHLIVGEATFGPFGGVPTWLNEGLAEYAKGSLEADLQTRLDKAVKQKSLISLRSLSGSFSSDPETAYLDYAESESFVTYLLDTYGWDKMNQLLNVFKEGSTTDGALKKVYLLDTNALDAAWKSFIGAGQPSTTSPVSAK